MVTIMSSEKNQKATEWLNHDPLALARILYILKALKRNTLIVYDHLALPGRRMIGNFIL